jgi:hypothetical protein
VRELLGYGFSQAEIADVLELTKSTIAYHARKIGEDPDERFGRRFDWAAIQERYDQGRSIRECQDQFGFSGWAWWAAVKRGAIVPRPRAMSIDELLSGRRNRTHVKQRLIAAGIKEDRCEQCGITSWRGRRLSLALHHVNGDGHDNRLENLQLLCPNCHSQTENYGARNRRAA